MKQVINKDVWPLNNQVLFTGPMICHHIACMCHSTRRCYLFCHEPLLLTRISWAKSVQLIWWSVPVNYPGAQMNRTSLTMTGYQGVTLQWRDNECDSVSNHQPHDCSLKCLFRRRSKKTSKLHVTGLCEGNSPVTGEFPAQGPVTRKMFPFDDVIMNFLRTYLRVPVSIRE